MLELEVQAIRLFQHRPRLWSPTRAVSVQPTLASHRPCAVLASLSVLHLLPRRACAARRAQRGAERPLRKLGSRCYLTFTACVTPLCKPVKISALCGPSSCTSRTLFQSRAKACSDRATPRYRRYDTLAKSPAPPCIAPSRPQPAASSPLRDLRMIKCPLVATRS